MTSKKPSTALTIAKQNLGIKQRHPSNALIESQTNKKIKQIEDGHVVSVCDMLRQFSDLLSQPHLQHLPHLPSDFQQAFAAQYQMHCFRYNGVDYCREIKQEGQPGNLVRTSKHWSKDANGNQKAISAETFDKMMASSQHPTTTRRNQKQTDKTNINKTRQTKKT